MIGLVSFAEDPRSRAYYDLRAAEYDDWWLGTGLFAARERPGWAAETAAVVELIGSLPAGSTLDVACGTAFLTRHLRGPVTALDQSPAMIGIARARLPAARLVRGHALSLPFANAAFERLLTAHFYGHLPPGERALFLREARRVARRLVVVDAALRPGIEPEQWQERVLNDGSRHRVFKRYLDASGLAAEIGGRVLLAGTWFVAAAAGPA